jgi:hypothetical protein
LKNNVKQLVNRAPGVPVGAQHGGRVCKGVRVRRHRSHDRLPREAVEVPQEESAIHAAVNFSYELLSDCLSICDNLFVNRVKLVLTPAHSTYQLFNAKG